MALIMDHQPDFKHFCKVCKKGFGCGRALGGHMRAHGIGDESGHLDDEDPASDWEAKFGATDVSATSNKRMYALRTNPNRLKSCRVCENCGKEFQSWKSFLEHGKCSSDDAESLLSSPAGSDDAEYGGGARRGCGNWSKRKRSLRAQVGNFSSNCPSSEEEDLANCLMMLSNANVDPNSVAEPEESCASASKEDQVRRNPMNFMAPLACKTPITYNKAKGVANKGLFECKACKKVFNSHQALGGHRASHKKVKGCFAARLDQGLDDNAADHEDAVTEEAFFPSKSTPTFQFDHNSSDASASKRKSKVHECSICHRVFSSGQALGGHKRCHWITSNSLEASSFAKFHQFQDHTDQIQQTPKFIDYPETLDLTLDLNLPAAAPPDDHTGGAARDNAANPASLEISTEIYLQSWVGVDVKEKDDNDHHNQLHKDHQNDEDGHKNNDNNNNNTDNNNTDNNNKNNDNIVNNNSSNGSVKNAGNEADSRVELAKLSELKEVSGNSSPWLNVGIGSTGGVSVDP